MKQVMVIGLAAGLLAGCDKPDDHIAQKVGEAIGQQATEFTKGVGKGIDQKMQVQVTLTPQVEALGLTNTIAKALGMGSTNSISVYLIASQAVTNTLMARALNADGVEVGRAKTPVAMQKDDAGYITFTFGELMDASVVKTYQIGM